ncbi:MAG: helix-turn-helix domain-containing protein [Treponema sp.]|nr:helix-turn-helix domain-containing protein [Treponema sp.]
MNQTVLSELLDREEASVYLRICKTTLDKLVISRIKIRRRVLYKKSELDKWLDQNMQIKVVQK